MDSASEPKNNPNPQPLNERTASAKSMNNPSPLVPQGSLQEKNKGRARVKIAVFFVLAVHGIGLLALLMQGCRRDHEPAPGAETNAVAPFEPTNVVVTGTSAPLPGASNNVASALETNPAPLSAGSDYTIAKGDNFTTIGKRFGVTAKAIAD